MGGPTGRKKSNPKRQNLLIKIFKKEGKGAGRCSRRRFHDEKEEERVVQKLM